MPFCVLFGWWHQATSENGTIRVLTPFQSRFRILCNRLSFCELLLWQWTRQLKCLMQTETAGESCLLGEFNNYTGWLKSIFEKLYRVCGRTSHSKTSMAFLTVVITPPKPGHQACVVLRLWMMLPKNGQCVVNCPETPTRMNVGSPRFVMHCARLLQLCISCLNLLVEVQRVQWINEVVLFRNPILRKKHFAELNLQRQFWLFHASPRGYINRVHEDFFTSLHSRQQVRGKNEQISWQHMHFQGVWWHIGSGFEENNEILNLENQRETSTDRKRCPGASCIYQSRQLQLRSLSAITINLFSISSKQRL